MTPAVVGPAALAAPAARVPSTPSTLDAAGTPKPSLLHYFSAFSGIGGFELGIQQAAPDWQCVGHSEIDRHALSVYNRHFPYHTNYGDITQICFENVPAFDLLVGGFPCQPYSQAGHRKGLGDARGGPILDGLFGLIEAKKPAYLLLENVKGLLSQDNGRTFQSILRRLDALGYRTEWQILDSQAHGSVPQKRERIYILGCRRPGGDGADHDRSFGTGSGGEVFPLAGLRTQDQSLAPGAASGVSEASWAFAAVSLHTHRTERGNPSASREPGEPLLRLGVSEPHFYTLTTRPFAALLIGCGDLSRFEPGKLLSEVMEAETLEPLPLRRLTPLEWERLQGFPDGWTGGLGLSDAQRYRCLGNAVTVGVVRNVVRKLRGRVETKSS